MRTSNDKQFNILSLDGGGVRGIFSAHLLNLINSRLNIDIYSKFDLVVGTSTGSIVAAFVATGKCLSDLVKEFEQNASKIFKSRIFSKGHCRSKYDGKVLEIFLKNNFEDQKLGDIETPLIINATNASTGEVHVFKSVYQRKIRNEDYVRDGEVFLYKAILASCSAPTYFDPVNVSETILCDGGVWANNPAMVGYVDAIRNFKVTSENIRIFSIGTGRSENFYLPSKNWGLLTGWGKAKFVDFAMLTQTQYADNCANLILGKNYLRINPQIGDWKLDNCKVIPTLKSIAQTSFSHSSTSINDFLNL